MPFKFVERLNLDVSEEASRNVDIESGFLGMLFIQAASDATITVSILKSGGTVILEDTLDVSVKDARTHSWPGGLDLRQSGSEEERLAMRQELNLGSGARINIGSSADADIFVFSWYGR